MCGWVGLPMLNSKHPFNFITAVLLRVARYLSLSQTHVCRERRTLWGERSEASFLPAAFKVTAEKQPKCEFSSSEFQNKERKKHPTETSLEQSTRPVDRIKRALTEPFPHTLAGPLFLSPDSLHETSAFSS